MTTMTSNTKSVKDRAMVVRALRDAYLRAERLARVDPQWDRVAVAAREAWLDAVGFYRDHYETKREEARQARLEARLKAQGSDRGGSGTASGRVLR